MKMMMVGDGVGIDGKESYGEIYWVNHIFTARCAGLMSDNSILSFGLDHTALCGKYFGALNACAGNKITCQGCLKIAVKIGFVYSPRRDGSA